MREVALQKGRSPQPVSCRFWNRGPRRAACRLGRFGPERCACSTREGAIIGRWLLGRCAVGRRSSTSRKLRPIFPLAGSRTSWRFREAISLISRPCLSERFAMRGSQKGRSSWSCFSSWLCTWCSPGEPLLRSARFAWWRSHRRRSWAIAERMRLRDLRSRWPPWSPSILVPFMTLDFGFRLRVCCSLSCSAPMFGTIYALCMSPRPLRTPCPLRWWPNGPRCR